MRPPKGSRRSWRTRSCHSHAAMRRAQARLEQRIGLLRNVEALGMYAAAAQRGIPGEAFRCFGAVAG